MNLIMLLGGFLLFLGVCFFQLKKNGLSTKEIAATLLAVTVMLALILLVMAVFILFIPPP